MSHYYWISLWFGLKKKTFKRAAVHDSGTSFIPSEVLLDPCRTWCPSSTCQAVCQLKEADSPALPQLVQCAVCALEFCSACKANWHPGQACQENNLPITSFLPGENRYCLSSDDVMLHLKFLFSQILFEITSALLIRSDVFVLTLRFNPETSFILSKNSFINPIRLVNEGFHKCQARARAETSSQWMEN